ncbi:PREDICTED: uncharacterized protein LOC104810129 isoform X2 [Tarenaya hassleriana]|uniref:uncharacterized protein LOC104810129 isoform X2 n=1 Tax=Tarenaya hassleriana TaxID=28532 RepID=UPI00053C818F|nr:PREDICTED: uncharacterized protein LOC104810129 isoform X2 [Tarenaya hassleriana]
MASCGSPDAFSWLQTLPPLSQWKTNSMSMCICSSNPSHPSLNFSVVRTSISSNTFTFSIVANFKLPISLWTSKPFRITTSDANKFLTEEMISTLLTGFIDVVLSYGIKRTSCSIRIPNPSSSPNLADVFNLGFHTFVFLVCIYEAPISLRTVCLNTIKNQLVTCRSRQGSKLLMVQLGSNLEELWMRSLNLAITNWMVEIRAAKQRPLLQSPSPLFSYGFSTQGLWKVHLYCPVIAMEMENSPSSGLNDERLFFSLNYHQLEGVIQFNHRIFVHDKWINVAVNIDNVRCDVIRLVNETLLSERGYGAEEKHFPSRISLRLTPTVQSNILMVSVTKSSENPTREFEVEKGFEATVDPPNTFFGLKVSAGETTTTSLKPWKFEEWVNGYSANLTWFLHDADDGREVSSSKPSKVSLMNPRAWFKNRYSSAFRPFNRQGGVVFAGDNYGQSVLWKGRNVNSKSIRGAC